MSILSKIFIFFLEFWHLILSPWMPAACRHEPTCSVYAAEAIRRHGLFKGIGLAFRRVSSCHPWGRHGFDPVP
ncbi:MAG: membrane protein insertion efficiency factor YidD [candidate division FCPU426 bacterium]